jgi:hypothetical protein
MAVYDPRGGRNTHSDVALTNISVAWPNNGLVGPVLTPAVTVRKQSDKYYVFGREAWAVDPSGDLRAPGTEANEIPGLEVSLDSYFADEHALKIAITDEERENVDSPMAPDRDGTELVTSKILLARELAIMSMVTTAASYATNNTVTLSGTSQFNDYTNSDPIGVFRTAFRNFHAGLFIEPNLAVIPYQVMTQLEDHPDFIARIQYVERGVLTAEIIASLLGLEQVIVPGAGYNSANPGQSASVAYLWGKDIVLAYVPPRPGLKIPAFAYEFVWGYGGNRPMVTYRWREQRRRSDLVEVSRRYDLKFVAKDDSGKSIAGYLIKDAVA